ncbi:MAG: DUF465 domain-containing protein [Rhizobiales bacterium]|nr:DUF465 domain-containing protein [Hyphomicrobiales bacterium]
MNREDELELRTRLARMRQQHHDLDCAIHALETRNADQLQLTRLKKQKLRLKDEIKVIENRLFPDIIA